LIKFLDVFSMEKHHEKTMLAFPGWNTIVADAGIRTFVQILQGH